MLPAFPCVSDLAVIFVMYFTRFFPNCRFMLCLLLRFISSTSKFLFNFFHIKASKILALQDHMESPLFSQILKETGTILCLLANLSLYNILINLPLAFFRKRLINKMPLFYLFSLSQKGHKHSKVKLHFLKILSVCLTAQYTFCLSK